MDQIDPDHPYDHLLSEETREKMIQRRSKEFLETLKNQLADRAEMYSRAQQEVIRRKNEKKSIESDN